MTRSRSLAAGCEDARTPALRLGMRAPWLTAREHEVATLAADGLTSKAIAERLVVSPRTVESHLYRIFSKLGVSDRTQLAEVLGR
jgi:DNA-binding NarL/FixJ family response regulator